jgi:hypothetical protein
MLSRCTQGRGRRPLTGRRAPSGPGSSSDYS